jgi:hypothetical protein
MSDQTHSHFELAAKLGERSMRSIDHPLTGDLGGA